MEEHVERMKQEYGELKQRLEKLNTFIQSNSVFKGLDNLEQVRMIKQAGFMESYFNILEIRIKKGGE